MIRKMTVMLLLALSVIGGVWANGSGEKEENITITMQHSMVPPEANELLKQYAEQYKEDVGLLLNVSRGDAVFI